MATETAVVQTAYNFPSHDLPADEKGADWCMQYLRAMYTEATTRQYAKIFFAARDQYKELREYALSKQSVLPFRKWLTGSDSQDKTWVNINWSIPTIGSKYRNILVNKLLSREFNITCTPVDPEAVDETAKWFSGMKAKMKLREMAQKVNPELLQTSALTKRGDDPEDMDDFQMRTQLGLKTKLAMDAEMGVQVVFQQNNIYEERKMVVEDLVDWGVGIYKDGVDENDMVTIEHVDAMKFVCSYCRRGDFKDMTWGGQLKYYTLSDIAPYFSPAELKDMAENVAGKNGNPRTVPYNFAAADYDKFRVLCLDGEWLTYNYEYYKRSYDSNNNYGFRKKRPDKRDGKAMTEVAGSAKPKFQRDTYDDVYKGIWIVDTNYVFKYGRATDQKRKKSSIKKTCLSFHVCAPDFYEMNALGVMERLKPFIDKYCQLHYKIENFVNKWIPYIIKIDISALENIPLGKGGKKLTPRQVLDMLAQTHMLVTRQKNAISGMPERNEPVSVEGTQMAQEINVLDQQLERTIQGMRDVTGLNEVVDGTGPADRTNVPAQRQAEQGSNNAINHFAKADSRLLERVAESSLLRLQRVLRRKPVSGYVHALGSNYIKFVQVSPDISLHEYAIALQDRPDSELKQLILQQVAIKDQQGLIQPEDYFMIMNMTNLKEVELKLIYSSKKRIEQQQQQAQANQQQTIQGQMQAAQTAEQEKQNTIRIKGEEDRKTEDVKGSWLVKAAETKVTGSVDQQTAKMIADIILQAMGQEHEKAMATAPQPPAEGPQPTPSGPQPVPASLQD